jgi:glycosyltransferase involved in cell wall biosynthesis
MPASARGPGERDARPLLLYVTDSEAMGGAEGYLQALIDHADQARFRLGLMLPARPATRPLAEAARRAGAEIVTLAFVHQHGLNLNRVRLIAAQLTQLRPAITHFVLPAPRRCAEAILAAWIARVPCRIATFQLVTPVPRFGPLAGALRGANRRLQYATLQRAVAVSAGNWRLLTEQYGVDAGRLTVIPNGVNLQAFRPRPDDDAMRASWGVPPGAPLIGVAARLTPTKGQRVLLEALPLLWERFPETHVVLAGEGPQEQELRGLASALPRPAQVRFVGQLGDMPAALAALDVFVLPSFAEGLPFAVLEAMAMERAVVASDVDGTQEAIEHQRSGLLVPPGDPERLAAALVRLLGDAALRERLGKAARQRVQVAFSQRSMLERTYALYERR